MCLIVVGWRVHPEFPLVVAANRDEFYARPTALASHWQEAPSVIGGRDLDAGGTWLGVTTTGRFAAVTNVREPGQPAGRCSRGMLTRDFLMSQQSVEDFAAGIQHTNYSGFNLLIGDGQSLWYATNRGTPGRQLPPGIYGLSNHQLDSPWPKLLTARQRFGEALAHLPDETAFFALLGDDATVDDANLPRTGVSLDWERRLSAIFVKSPDYGTRASTLLRCRRDGAISLHERSFGPEGVPTQSSVITTGV